MSPSKGASASTVHSSTPDKCTETYHRSQTRQVAKQPTTPGQKRIYLGFIYDALGAKPQEPSSLEDILNWIRVNRLDKYREYGGQKLRTAIQMSLNFQTKKVESKRTIWAYSDGNSIGKWQLHKPVVAVTDDEQSVDTYTERHLRTPSMPGHSSGGGRTFDSTLVSCEDTPPSAMRETHEQYGTISQSSPHTSAAQMQSESRPAFVERESNHPSPEVCARSADGNPGPDGASHSAPNAVGHPSNRNEPPVQADPAPENFSMAINNEPSKIEDSRAPAILCDDSGKYSKDEPDYGQIVRNLRRLKHTRKLQEQKIEADQNSLPDVTSLTKSASDAQRAADEARRAAEEAQRTAETAKNAVEDAEGKHAQLAADKLGLAKLTEESGLLRAQLGID